MVTDFDILKNCKKSSLFENKSLSNFKSLINTHVFQKRS